MKVLNPYAWSHVNPQKGEIAIKVRGEEAGLYMHTNSSEPEDEGASFYEKTKYVLIESGQTLSEEQQQSILNRIGLSDENVTITLTSDLQEGLVGATFYVTYGDVIKNFTWLGVPITFTVSMYAVYTIHFNNIEGFYKPDSLTYKAERNGSRNISVRYEESTEYIDLSMCDFNGVQQEQRETANCYVVHTGGTYEFPLVYGCAIQRDEIVVKSYVPQSDRNTAPFVNYLNNQITSPYIEIDTQVSAATGELIYSDYGYGGGEVIIDNIHFTIRQIDNTEVKFLRFNVDNSIPYGGGNAVIAIKDASGQIMWSWHIWVYPYDLHLININTETESGECNILDVNLGWVKYENTVYGTCPYYQWGRKDPMIRLCYYNVDEGRLATSTTTNFSAATDCAHSVAEAIQHPNVFYDASCDEDDKYNWVISGDTAFDFYNYWNNYDFWSGFYRREPTEYTYCEKTIYDPCPPYLITTYPSTLEYIATSAVTTSVDYGLIITGLTRNDEEEEWIVSERFLPFLGYQFISYYGYRVFEYGIDGYGDYKGCADNMDKWGITLGATSSGSGVGELERYCGYPIIPQYHYTT